MFVGGIVRQDFQGSINDEDKDVAFSAVSGRCNFPVLLRQQTTEN